MTVAFVLASWRPDAPAGMERAVAAHAAALVEAGHNAMIITADPIAPTTYRTVSITKLRALDGCFPCDDDTLRSTIEGSADRIRGELTATFHRYHVDVAVYVDALWGLGRIMPTCDGVRNVLAVHVVGHHTDLRAALGRQPTSVIAPSNVVLLEATSRGYDTTDWAVVPNTVLTLPDPHTRNDRQALRRGPIRVLARLGPEKGVTELLRAVAEEAGPVDLALAKAPFEVADGSQDRLLDECQTLAEAASQVTIRGALRWNEVPRWLGDASVVIVPSLAETFGLVALEAMAADTPVIAHDVGNLPHLIGAGGVIVAGQEGAGGLWRAARRLLSDPVAYGKASRAAYYRSRDYWPALVANQLLKVVS